MPLITLDDVGLAYGHVALLDHAALVVESGERIGLIGRNGTGKSSLLKIVADKIAADDGKVWRRPELKFAMVEQEPDLDPEATVYDAVADGFEVQAALLKEYNALTHRLEQHESDAAALHRLQELQTQLERAGGWNVASQIEMAIGQVALDSTLRIATLSGGMKKKVALARALVNEPELLLLDEPTNHLDIVGIEWLETLLKSFSGSALFVTHDRRFLDNVCTRIIELDRGRLASFPGNYATYQHRKEELLAAEEKQNARFDKLLAQEEVWIRKGVEARRTRNEGRVDRLIQLRRERALRREQLGKVQFDLDPGSSSGKLVAELTDVSKSFGGKRLIDNFSCVIKRGDKVGLIGSNGCGKTTLLKLLLGLLEPDSGKVRQGTKLEIAYFDQLRAQLDEDATLAEVISPGNDFVTIGGASRHVMSYLSDFLFPPQRARAKVSSLSGGERARLLLARLFAQPANVLVLDEPTNDIDIETLELLENLLQEYPGTVFLASHDRSFLDNVVTQVISFEGNGVLGEYAGGYEDAKRARAARDAQAKSTASPSSPVQAKAIQPERNVAAASRPKMSFKEVRELESLPDAISKLEAEHATVSNSLADTAIYREQPEKVKLLKLKLTELDTEIARSMARWEELEARSSALK